ncbi:FIG01200667: hypothetical protein [hydrothermal vent metagenome]|uniref:Uncharacterized protein n=1 Tax=hydrothermal vent metagenome TaxID=652676 RepID=A0A3B0XAV9_9ZZZZ
MNGFVDTESIVLLGISLAIGLLIGVERGWKSRQIKDGGRIAGLRTYGLTGLLGGVAGVLSQYLGVMVFGFVFLGFTAAVTVAYVMQQRVSGDVSITSLVTMLLTFMLGALATLDYVNLAASSAVVTAILLRYKDVLHRWLEKLEDHELRAVLQLLLISIVLLPILPDRGYGPWQALNPYEIWWMVVLIAGISFIGYFSMKIAGPGKGIILTSLAAGMVSSTALTLHYARLSKSQTNMKGLLGAGILLACATMFPRVLLISSLINPALFNQLIVPMAVMTLLILSFAAVVWHKKSSQPLDELTQLKNPLELKPALFFSGLLIVVILLGKTAIYFFGDAGLYILAAVSGIADVDPINLTISRMSSVDLSLDVAVLGIIIATTSNTMVKAVLALSIGGQALVTRVFLPLFVAAVAGLITAWLA